jgi:hypothetical protein
MWNGKYNKERKTLIAVMQKSKEIKQNDLGFAV